VESIELNEVERDLLRDALWNYASKLNLLISLPDEIQWKEFHKGKLDEVMSLRDRIA
jgi:hypothetical protein